MKNLIFLVLMIALTVQAQDGAGIAAKGTTTGAPACISCHGAKGEGQAATGFPRLAGQSADYMTKQLNDFASEQRPSPVMNPIAKALTEQERELVSQYYAKFETPANPPAQKAAKSLVQLGERLARKGDGKLQLQACNNCHGPDGVGLYPAIPQIAGQQPQYLETQLRAWKSGQRTKQFSQMAEVAQRLDEKSIKALSAYFAQVRLK